MVVSFSCCERATKAISLPCPAAGPERQTARKQMERSRTFFSCVPCGRAQRVAFTGCTMGNDDRSRGGLVDGKRLRMFGNNWDDAAEPLHGTSRSAEIQRH